MVLDGFRATGERLLGPLAGRLEKGGADRLTFASFVAAACAGLAFSNAGPASAYLLVLGAFAVFASAVLDALDGMVARRTKSASPAGDFLDHALDRYADLFIIGGLAASAFGDFRWGFFALTGVLLTSYMATQAAAVGLHRDYGGLLGRADRLVLLTAVPLLQALLVLANVNYTATFELPWRGAGSPPEVVNPVLALLMAFAVLGHLTALQRFVRARRALVSRESELPENPAPRPPPGR